MEKFAQFVATMKFPFTSFVVLLSQLVISKLHMTDYHR